MWIYYLFFITVLMHIQAFSHTRIYSRELCTTNGPLLTGSSLSSMDSLPIHFTFLCCLFCYLPFHSALSLPSPVSCTPHFPPSTSAVMSISRLLYCFTFTRTLSLVLSFEWRQRKIWWVVGEGRMVERNIVCM